jgi:hypothetical protein
MALLTLLQIGVFGVGFYLSRSERKLQWGIGVALEIISVLLIVLDLIRWGMTG